MINTHRLLPYYREEAYHREEHYETPVLKAREKAGLGLYFGYVSPEPGG